MGFDLSIDFVIKEDKDSITRSQKGLLLTFAWEGSAATIAKPNTLPLTI